MALFSTNPIRSAATAAIVVCIAHFGTMLLTSLHAFQLTQTSIAILSISALLFMIMMHHKMDGRFMNQTQEEMAVIGIFALLWVAFLVGYKGITSKHGGNSATTDLGTPQSSQEYSGWGDPCAKGDAYCIYEEYTYF
ncbi:hypothetical protein BJ912DRAFT_17321 [Pholiota molesta]|nr:hypothetical protein BJ912DRAFT_17321 [Pholiota molesta]